jgi:plastocyanin
MTRRALSILVLAVAAVALALLGAFLFSGRASAFGPGYGHGMMGGSGYHSGYGMTGGYASSGSASLLIRHQRAHCHAWSLNGGAFKAAQQVTLDEGSSLTIINNDVMPHRLVKLAGATVTMRNGTVMPMMGGYVSQTPGLMSHMGARTTVTFQKAGVYRFRTRAGEDYMPGITTTGEDNVLTLTVTVR